MTWETSEQIESTSVQPVKQRRHSWWAAGAILALLALIGVAFFLKRNWPFTQANVIQQLGEVTSSTVRISSFRPVFLPHPGCIASGVTFERGSDNEKATMTVQNLVIEGSLTGLVRKHLALIRLEGTRVLLPEFGTAPTWQPTNSKIVLDELSASDATLEFARHDPKSPKFAFAVHQFVAHHLASRDPMSFEVSLKNPTPPGEVVVKGSFGPWNNAQLSATPLSGQYSFRDADLGVFHGIHGILASDGQFRGTLQTIVVNGQTLTPAFAVDGGAHKLPLDTIFDANVNSSNGDVQLQQVKARLLRTTIFTRGSVASKPGHPGKTTGLEMYVHNGRIQDLFLLFVSEKKSPLEGTVTLRATTRVPPGEMPFLKKLRATGDFGIDSAAFTKQETQENLDKLSAAARGQADQTDNPEDVVSDLQGHVEVENGIATFTDLRFRVPGARARLQGTFNLLNDKVDFHGLLFMDANLPKATSGIKSFLLRAIDPFLKKNRHGGARIPVSITGTYQHPSYKADPV